MMEMEEKEKSDEIFVCGARDCLTGLLPVSADLGVSSGRAGPIYSLHSTGYHHYHHHNHHHELDRGPTPASFKQ